MFNLNSKISVCYVSFPLGIGGPQAWLTDVLHNIDQNKYKLSVIILGNNGESKKEWLNKIEGQAKIYHLGNSTNPVIRVWALIKKLRNLHIDIIHSSVDLIDAEVMLASSIVGIPIRISHARNSNFLKIEKYVFIKTHYNLLRKLLINKLSTSLFAISESAKNHHFGFSKKWEKCGYYVPTFIDVKNFLESTNISNDKKRNNSVVNLCHIGRFGKQKNQIFSLNLMSFLLEKLPAHLYLIGNGRGREILEQRVYELGLQNSVTFVDPTHKIWEIMKTMDVCLFPSNWEGFGRVVVESQAMGIPVVCSTEIPIEAIIIDNLVYRLCLSDSIENWCKAIIEAVNAEKPSREYIKLHFEKSTLNVTNGIREMQKIYEQLCLSKI